jgi:hypothetical protein
VRSSLYTRAAIHPVAASAAAVGAGLVLTALWRNRERDLPADAA